MAKLVRLDGKYYPQGGFGHWCPACDNMHEITVDEPNHSGAKWLFDGNATTPTFSPSVNLCINPPGHHHYQPDLETIRCHYFITSGRIIFCGDCTHGLAGQTVDLPDFPDHACLGFQRL